MQKTATRFRYVREDWHRNAEEEGLLGVDITGHADCPLLRFDAPGRESLLRELGQIVDETDALLSARFHVNRGAALTTVKPAGDSSVLFDSASGISARYAKHQIRWVRESMHSPVAAFLKAEGVPHAVAPEDPSLVVFGFPKQAPAGSTLRNDMTAIQQLENWLVWKKNWVGEIGHNVSCTIYVEPHEWLEVGQWVHAHFDWIGGLSLMPKDNGVYRWAPNEELTESQYEEMVAQFPKINWAKLIRFEDKDQTTSFHNIACVGGGCDQ